MTGHLTTGAIRIHTCGGPDVLQWETVALPPPGPGEVVVRHEAVGLNYIDTYHRTGLYPLPAYPAVLGLEGAGVVETLGPGVESLRVGDRVAYASPPVGAYAEARVMPAARLVLIPEGISSVQAAGMMLQGMTAEYLLRRTYPVKAGETILVHAAAGGVGLVLCQWASHLGARVIGTVGSEAKAELARAHGCHETILYNQENFVTRVRALTDGAGVPVVYDGVGKTTWEGSLDCLKPRGYMVSFGQASGPVPAFEPALLGTKGSLFLTRPSLMAYTITRAELEESANALFAVVASGVVRIPVRQTFPLRDAATAHRALEARETVGATVLLP